MKTITKSILGLIIFGSITIANADNQQLARQMLQLNQEQLAPKPANLWQRMRLGFALDHSETKDVKYWEKRYANPKYFAIIMQNAGPYLYFVVTEMERRGIPTELALIPIVETTYNPNAVSPAKISTGMWQFTGSSGRRFGLLQNSNLDERQDVVKGTRAAIAYLQYLYNLFGSWELAIAAYNLGEGNIANAVNKAGTRNFYELKVRDITRQYVPKVIALANIINNPRRFGIHLTNLANQPYFALINPPQAVSMSNWLQQADLSADLNHKLNPQYKSLAYVVNPSQHLLLPITNQNTYLANNNYHNSYLAAQTTTIDPSSTEQLASIAPPSNIANAKSNTHPTDNNDLINQLASRDTATSHTHRQVQPSKLKKPSNADINDLLATDNSKTTAPKAKIPHTHFISYTVTRGDTLSSIAKKFSLSMARIRKDNQLASNTVKPKQKLRIRQVIDS